MTHTKTFTRPDGSRVRIKVSLHAGDMRDETPVWNYSIYTKDFNQKKWRQSICKISVATPAEILQAKLELWEKIKPIE